MDQPNVQAKGYTDGKTNTNHQHDLTDGIALKSIDHLLNDYWSMDIDRFNRQYIDRKPSKNRNRKAYND